MMHVEHKRGHTFHRVPVSCPPYNFLFHPLTEQFAPAAPAPRPSPSTPGWTTMHTGERGRETATEAPGRPRANQKAQPYGRAERGQETPLNTPPGKTADREPLKGRVGDAKTATEAEKKGPSSTPAQQLRGDLVGCILRRDGKRRAQRHGFSALKRLARSQKSPPKRARSGRQGIKSGAAEDAARCARACGVGITATGDKHGQRGHTRDRSSHRSDPAIHRHPHSRWRRSRDSGEANGRHKAGVARLSDPFGSLSTLPHERKIA